MAPLLVVLMVVLWSGSLVWNATASGTCDQGRERVTTAAYSFTVPDGFRHMPKYDSADLHYLPPVPEGVRPPDEPGWVTPYARTELRMCIDPRTEDRVIVSVGAPPTPIRPDSIGQLDAWLDQGYGTSFSPIMVDGHIAYVGVIDDTVEIMHLFAGSFVVDVRCQREGHATWQAVVDACQTVIETLQINDDLDQLTAPGPAGSTG